MEDEIVTRQSMIKSTTIVLIFLLMFGFSPSIIAYDGEPEYPEEPEYEITLIDRLSMRGQNMAKYADTIKLRNWILQAYSNLTRALPDYLNSFTLEFYKVYGNAPSREILVSALQAYLWSNLTMLDAQAWAETTDLDFL